VVIFITGKSGAGKTTLAKKLKKDVIIDGDDFREYFDAGYSIEEKEAHIIKMAKTAAMLEKQGLQVVVAAIMPTKRLRNLARKYCSESVLIYLSGGTMWKGTEYEIPGEDELCTILS
jgi:adenylylsulfate kinase-like enzyme